MARFPEPAKQISTYTFHTSNNYLTKLQTRDYTNIILNGNDYEKIELSKKAKSAVELDKIDEEEKIN